MNGKEQMSIEFRNNCKILNFGADYHKIRSFLVKLDYPTYHFGRWDWMVTHSNLDKMGIPKIGVWEDDNNIVALATYDMRLGETFFCVYDEYVHLKKEMAEYASDSFRKDGKHVIIIENNDSYFQNIASDLGFIATESTESTAAYPIDLTAIKYKLPEGFNITSMKETYDLFQYGQVLWRGFDHETRGEGIFKLENAINSEIDFKRPNVNLDLKIAAVAPNGDFVSYCGRWYDEISQSALVEPVATDPNFRKMGLGKAVVLEAVKRCGVLGAKTAYVGSTQQFYYTIGFRPYSTATRWVRK